MDFTTVSNELHKQSIHNFPRRRVVALSTYQILSMDLMDMIEIEKQNNGYKYIFSVIDVFSKFGWLVPLKDKKATTILEELKHIINDIDVKPEKLWSDKGSEFYNKDMTQFLKRNKITQYSTYGENKAVVVERFNRTIKNWIWRIFTSKHTRNWVIILDELQEFYNNRVHRSIKMKPVDAIKPQNKDTVFHNLYGEYYNELLNDDTIYKPKFKIGDLVRISRVKEIFEKGFHDNFSRAVYKVVKVLETQPITYNLTEFDNTPLDGGFYEQELQKTDKPDFYEIEKIIKDRKFKKKKQYFVKWLGWETKYNTWIDEAELKDIQ